VSSIPSRIKLLHTIYCSCTINYLPYSPTEITDFGTNYVHQMALPQRKTDATKVLVCNPSSHILNFKLFTKRLFSIHLYLFPFTFLFLNSFFTCQKEEQAAVTSYLCVCKVNWHHFSKYLTNFLTATAGQPHMLRSTFHNTSTKSVSASATQTSFNTEPWKWVWW
jgi:hypothetical protein